MRNGGRSLSVMLILHIVINNGGEFEKASHYNFNLHACYQQLYIYTTQQNKTLLFHFEKNRSF